MPNLTSNARNSGVLWMRRNSAPSVARIAGGVPAGATTPCHACQSKPGTLSAIGGTPAIRVVGFALEVPSATTLPDWMLGMATVASLNMSCTLPVIRSGNAASVPLYGICSVSYTHLRAHETRHDLVCRLLLEKK